MKPLLKLQKISKKYSSFIALDNIDLEIFPSQIVGIIGKSGCGKSTLAKMMLFLEKPDEGFVFFEEKRVDQMNKKERLHYRKNIQMVFQNPYSSLNPCHTIEAILLEPFLIHNIDPKDSLLQLIALMHLPYDTLKRYPHEFSGRERQRFAIARAMSLHPKCLVLDEPTSALDVAIAAQIMQTLKELQITFPMSMVFISHDLAQIRHFCDQLVLMDEGKIIEKSSVKSFFNNPQSEIGRSLIQSAQFLDPIQRQDKALAQIKYPI